MVQETEHQETTKDEELIRHSGCKKAKKGYRAISMKPLHCRTIFGIVLILLFVMIILAFGLAVALGVTALKPCLVPEAIVTYVSCPDGWVGYLGKCYYFSEDESDWLTSLRNCSLLGASLSFIETEQEMSFLLRYKGPIYHWIGLRRDQGKPWEWADGRIFNNTLFDIVRGGDCAYLNDVKVMSSWCKTKKNWICSKPDN